MVKNKRVKDLSGRRFGKMTVLNKYEIRRIGPNKKRTKAYWLCKCDCGKEKWVRGTSLTQKHVVSCSCYRSEQAGKRLKELRPYFNYDKSGKVRDKSIKNLSGKRFGKLVVQNNYERIKSGKGKVTKWLCRCDCGNEVWVQRSSLRRKVNGARSCGCLIGIRNRELRRKEYGFAAKKHAYFNYTGRCKQRNIVFELDLDSFISIVKQNCYYCGVSPMNKIVTGDNNGDFLCNGIDRVDNSKGYIEGNCVPCCRICNRAKDIMSKEEFFNWVEKIYNNFVSKEKSLC